jgi:hypothetical protein
VFCFSLREWFLQRLETFCALTKSVGDLEPELNCPLTLQDSSFLFDKVASFLDRQIEKEVVQACRDHNPARVVSFCQVAKRVS